MKKKSIGVLIIVSLLISLTLIQIEATEGIKQLQDQLKNNENKIKDINSIIKKSENEKDSVENDIKKLDLELEKLQLEIDNLELKISEYNLNIEKQQNKIDKLNEEIDLKNQLLEDRLRVMYKKGMVGYAEVLLNSEDIGDFLTRLDMVQKIVDNDVDVLKDIEESKEEVSLLQLKLQNEKNEVLVAKEGIESNKTQIQTVSRAKETRMSQLEQDINELQIQEDKFLADLEKLSDKIKQMQIEMEYAGGEMAWPAPNVYRITSPYGMRMHPVYKYWKMHSGIDIGIRYSDLVAANDGVVIYAGYNNSYGYLVIIDHGSGISTAYGHNSKIYVTEGQKVKKGEVISLSGTTGISTGPHLHFEVRENGDRVDPLNYYQHLIDLIYYDI